MTAPPCALCRHPFGPNWHRLSRRARFEEPVATYLCPRCTVARTGVPWIGAELAAMYRARACEGDDLVSLFEDDEGNIRPNNRDRRRALMAARRDDVRRALDNASFENEARVLHVGCRDGELLGSLRAAGWPVTLCGVEPWRPWRRRAEARKVEVRGRPLEWCRDLEEFDVIAEHGLVSHLFDPIDHLKHLRRRLSDGGVAVIEVPNLLQATGFLAEHVLRADRPHCFTPRALATACTRVGLIPFDIDAGQRLRLLCRKGEPGDVVVPGPSADAVAEAAWGNELRLTVKRMLAVRGPSSSVIQVAASVHRRCTSAPVRADIAIEIANGCERCSDYQRAAQWLQNSLDDRADPEVHATLCAVREVQSRLRGAAAEVEPPRLRLVS